MARTTLSLALIATVAAVVNARPEYANRIPNGNNVEGIKAVGHVNTDGGGQNNQFGKDFKDVGEVWTVELCVKDSDDDGQTNGQELGDPCCEISFDKDAPPRWTVGVSHPGNATLMSDESLWSGIVCPTFSPTDSIANPPAMLEGYGEKSESGSGSVSETDSVGTTTNTNSTTDRATTAPVPASPSATLTMSRTVYCVAGIATAVVAYLM
ncbi:unnamed protein product [Peronospora belbahrii]|uniref:Temptin Cys/Cys disulfide domain-containing protein n=1 Tax=Peronospora belbahrii TaxID=622444 RepID=A0AAU9L789_9STRA|nr:unnamed protein product [Peronospora belbahrii]CAH0519673.1 unnamed protein product [Peronospora belbahrii]